MLLHVVTADEVQTIGVVGAGTMGSGIAQVAAQAGFSVVLYDLEDRLLDRGLGNVRGSLARFVERGRLTPDEVEAALGRIAPTTDFGRFRQADLVIEAAVEDLETKRRIFADLDRTCPPHAVLATNTSSLSVTQLGAATDRPDRVVGMHFFNPAPIMALVEVVRGRRSSEEAVQTALALARRLGKTPVLAQDTPGFIANRVARPFTLEALRALQDGLADVPTIDRVLRAAGFRMGPFELMDLVGIDVGFAVQQSIYEQSFHEPRFRPSPISQQMVRAGLLGRKTGRGYYDYAAGPPEPVPAGPQPPSALPRVVVLGTTDRAGAVQRAAAAAGLALAPEGAAPTADLALLDLAPPDLEPVLTATLATLGGPVLLDPGRASVGALAARCGALDRLIGFRTLGPFDEARLVELSLPYGAPPERAEPAAAFFRALGKEVALVGDAVAGLAERVVCALVNEAAFALGEGVASAADIDLALRLGMNYPVGPLAWGDRLGAASVLATLEALLADSGDPRYRPAPLLRRVAEVGGRLAGE